MQTQGEMETIRKACVLIVLATNLLLVRVALAETNAYAGMWWDASKGGMGVNVEHQGQQVFVTWFAYGANGAPTWLLMQGTLAGGVISASIYSFSGPQYGPGYNPNAVNGTVVGIGVLSFRGANNATLTYNVSGIGGTLQLTRFTVGKISLTGTFYGGAVIHSSNCGAQSYLARYDVAHYGSSLIITETSGDSVCTISGTASQAGSRFAYSGTVWCDDGRGGTVDADVTVSDYSFAATGTMTYTRGISCVAKGTVGGIR